METTTVSKMSEVDFLRFWAAYPRHEAKKAARVKFLQLSKDLLEPILASIEVQKNGDLWKRGFIPHASTWINQERWEDEVFTPPSEEPKKTYSINGKEVSKAEYEARTRKFNHLTQ